MTLARDTSHIKWDDYFYYDETSPSCLRWKIDRANGKVKANTVAGRLIPVTNSEIHYWVVCLLGVQYMAHRVIWELIKGKLGREDNIDHIDGDGRNNKIDNLLSKDHRQNCQNKKKQRDNTSGVTGVYFNVKKNRKGDPLEYWMASWIDEYGVQRTKCFNIDKLGYDNAFELACKYRSDMLDCLNTGGCWYTKQHGIRE